MSSSTQRMNSRQNIKLTNISYVSPLAYTHTNPNRIMTTSRQNTSTQPRQSHPNMIFLEKKGTYVHKDLSFSKSKRSTSNKSKYIINIIFDSRFIVKNNI